MKFELPKLPYAIDALEPYIDHKTLEFHHGKPHQAYVNKLNGLIEGTEFENKSLEEIIKTSEAGIFNNAAQAWNHTFYFESFAPNKGGEPTGALLEGIKKDFGSFDNFKDEFSKAAATLFGSGWAWLVRGENDKLEIVKESNAGNPLTSNEKPLLTIDVWEHAYYLDYQNKRPDYISAFWKIVNWDTISGRL